MISALVVLAAALGPVATTARAQFYTGRIDITVVDSTGAVLPSTSITLTGPITVAAVTDARGEARFLNLAPGTYAVAVTRSGFNEYTNASVPVAAGAIVPLRVTLTVAGVTSMVNVIAGASMVDPRRTVVSTSLTVDDLRAIPTSRDPWVILQTIPGVIVDRVNVGGAESGQQSFYIAKGAGQGENTWHIDGIPVTDMSALGASPAYYDFDMFQEMQLTTGGADVSSASAGVALNVILKSGGNKLAGSARYFFENDALQADNLPEDLRARLGGVTGKGNRMDAYNDYGAEAGGPLVRDRVWAWGAFGKTDVGVITLGGAEDSTFLTNYSAKGTAQIAQDLRAVVTYFRSVKEKIGRDVGPTRPPETGWNQTGPTALYKAEANYVVDDSLFVTGRFAHVSGGFSLTPAGGLDRNMVLADDGGIGRFTWYAYDTDRPQNTMQVEANYFSGRHEIRAGVGYRTADVDTRYTVPGDGVITYHAGYPNMIAEVTAWNQFTGTSAAYASGFVADTISFDRITINAGLRWDRQASSVNPYAQAGNTLLPGLLPDLTGQGAEDAIVWNSLSPRVGVSYVLTDSRKTVLRASYAAFPSQMNASEAGFFSSVGSLRGVLFFDVHDANSNQTVDPEEIAGRTCGDAIANTGACSYYGFNIANPGDTGASIHTIGAYSTPTTHEIVAGVDHELMPNVGISGHVTWRRFTNFNWQPVQGLRGDDYQLLGTFTGSIEPVGEFSVPFYGVTAAGMPVSRAATEYVTREGYSQRFLGFELAATKRLSNRWMARLGFSTNDHREFFDSPLAFVDPTPTPGNPNIDGGAVLRETAGSGKTGIYMVLPTYQFVATGMYRGWREIDFGLNLLVRQGYAAPYYRSQVETNDPLDNLKSILLTEDVTDFRLPPVASLDLRVGRGFAIGRARVDVDVAGFNVLNLNTVLRRQYDLRLSTADNVLEIMSPLILRLGARVTF
jgi:hypothetical protein